MIDAGNILSLSHGSVGFVGVGRMGAAMFDAVIDSGFSASVYDPSDDAVARFRADDRVRVASSPADLAADAAVVSVVVNTAQQLRAACLGEDGVLAGARPGMIVLVHSTIDQECLHEIAKAGADRGVHVLDAPVTGRWGHASIPDLGVMVGGSAEAFAAVEPVFRAYGSLVVHIGPLGSGLDTKLALNLYRYLNMLAQREAGTLLASAGVDAPFEEIIAHSGASGGVGPPPPDVQKKLNEFINPDRFVANAAQARKDLRAAVARGDELGVRLGTADAAVGLIHSFWGAPPPADPSVD